MGRRFLSEMLTVCVVLAAGCQPVEPQETDARQGPASLGGTGALDSKRFVDGEFLCTAEAGLREDEGDDAAAEGDDEELSLTEDEAEAEDETLTLADVTYEGQIAALLKSKCVSCHKAGATPPDLSSFALATASGDVSLETIVNGTMPPGKPLPQADQDAFQAWVDGGYLQGKPGAGDAAKGTKSKPTTKPAKPAPKASDTSGVCAVPDGVTQGGDAKPAPAPGPAPKPAPGPKPAPKPAPAPGPAPAPAPGPGPAPAPATPTYVGAIKALLDAKCVTCHKAGATPPDLADFAKAKAGGPRSLVRIQDGTMPTDAPLPKKDQDLFKAWVDAGYPEK